MRIWYVPNHLGDPTIFLDKLTSYLEKTWIDTSNLFMDHICYRTASNNDYEEKKHIIDQWAWKLLIESTIWWRLIATYKLFDPILYKDRLIDVLELPAPKPGSQHTVGREHVEFVIPETLESFYLKHSDRVNFITKWLAKKHNPDVEIEFEPWVACKFHTQSLENVIAIEKLLQQ